MAKMLERMERMANGDLPPAPIAETLGFRLLEVRPGEAIFSIDTEDRHANPMGTLHGGVLCDVADAAMGCAYGASLEDGESFTTLELKINFLKPVWKDRLTATGRVVQKGRTVGLADCTVTNSKGERVAYATSTCMTLRGEQARGR
jgi:uncharacterized protein (TIGR00369 family)